MDEKPKSCTHGLIPASRQPKASKDIHVQERGQTASTRAGRVVGYHGGGVCDWRAATRNQVGETGFGCGESERSSLGRSVYISRLLCPLTVEVEVVLLYVFDDLWDG
jgi:hypothetical protein